MKTLREENGQALVITVLSMTILLGFAALAGDVGIMYRTKRVAQTAADAAAIAGAQQIIFGNTGNVTTAAVNAAAQNGMTNGANGATITVNNPPQNGPFAAKTNTAYVEVIASKVEPTIFMKMFNFNSLTVSSRAVAYSGGAGTNCLYVLNQTASNSFDLQGNFNVTAPNCGVIVDSSANPALNCTGGAGTMNAGSVAVVGGANCNPGQVNPTPVTGVAPVSDPLAALPVPTFNPSSCTAYPGGANIGPATAGGTVCYNLSGITMLSNVNLSPGTYVFTGNGIVTFGGTVTGTGVTLFLDTNVNLDATNGTLNLTAPTSGTYSGLLIFAETQNSGGAAACNNRNTNYNLCFAKGTATGTLTGIIYAPHASMELHDQAGGLSLTTDLIVDTLYDQTGIANIQSYTQSHGNSPLKKVVLVE